MAESFPLAPGNTSTGLPLLGESFSASEPTGYMGMEALGYSPLLPELPDYCRTVLDCGSLYGNSCLAGMYGWDFSRSCEFWRAGIPLTEEDRERTLLGRRIKMIGLDVAPLALEYSRKMNTIDEFIVQDFAKKATAETRQALVEADVMLILQCAHYMPTDYFRYSVDLFLTDRTRPKRLIYGRVHHLERRDTSPATLLHDIPGMVYTEQVHNFRYAKKMVEECPDYRTKPRDTPETNYQVDFKILPK